MNEQCKKCHTSTFNRLLDYFDLQPSARRVLEDTFFKQLNSLAESHSPAELARDVHSWFRTALKNPDPYASAKADSNDKMLGLYPTLKHLVERSNDPFDTALRLAIGGNIIDLGPSTHFDVDHTIQRVLSSPLAIDDSRTLKQSIDSAHHLLYLADNAGEIVLDRLFLETVNHPNVTVAVRERPVINDATLEDARYVGLDSMAALISNGDDAPSTLLHRSSTKFRQVFDEADCVISKGMGNFEGLCHCNKDNLYFLLIVKCQYIGDLLDVRTGDFVARRHPIGARK